MWAHESVVAPEMSGRRIALALTGLGLGLVFYLGYRSDQTVSNRLLRWICSQSAYEHGQVIARHWLPVPSPLRGCLPSALWCLIASSLTGGWKLCVGRRWILPCASLSPWINAAWEIVQGLGWTDGCGDVLDGVAGIAGWALAAFMLREVARAVPLRFSWNWRMGVVALAFACMGFADIWR